MPGSSQPAPAQRRIEIGSRRRVEGLAHALRARVRLRTRIAGLRDRSRLRDPHASGADPYATWVERYDILGRDEARGMRHLDMSLDSRPRFSLLLALDGEQPSAVASLVDSVTRQAYGGWELVCACPDAACSAGRTLESAGVRDRRIRVIRPAAGGAATLDDALHAAHGDYCVVVDEWSRPRPHALLLLAEALNTRPDAVLVYSDEDRIDARGRRHDHWFKPEWNPSLLLSTNYVGGLAAFPLERVRELGGIGAGGSWGVYLRLTHDVDPARVVHVPHVLVHREVGDAGGAAASPDAVQAYLDSTGIDAAVEPVGTVGVRVVRRLPRPAPPVRLVVATGCLHDRVGPCLESVLRQTDYPDLRLSLVVDDRMEDDPRKRLVVERLTADERVDVVRYPHRPFSYAWVHNWAISRVEEELLCLLNDDVWVIEPRWLALMVGHLLEPNVGAVGARLLYPDGTVQHGGVILGTGGVAGHYHQGLHRASTGYHGRGVLDQDLSCVTAACMALRRAAYETVGGFDEGLAIAFNDVDLCIKLREAGWRIVLAAGAELFHGESTSLGPHDSAVRYDQFVEECRRMQARWGPRLRGDPAVNPNLDLDRPGSELAFPPTTTYPWRIGSSSA